MWVRQWADITCSSPYPSICSCPCFSSSPNIWRYSWMDQRISCLSMRRCLQHLVAYAFAWSLPVLGLLSHLLFCLAWLVAWSLLRLVCLFLKDSSKFLGGRRWLPKLFSDLGWFNILNDYRGVIVRFWYFEGALGDFSFCSCLGPWVVWYADSGSFWLEVSTWHWGFFLYS